MNKVMRKGDFIKKLHEEINANPNDPKNNPLSFIPSDQDITGADKRVDNLNKVITKLKNIGLSSGQVTETFDGTYAPAIAQIWLNLRKAYPWTQIAVAKTLVRLKAAAEVK